MDMGNFHKNRIGQYMKTTDPDELVTIDKLSEERKKTKRNIISLRGVAQDRLFYR